MSEKTPITTGSTVRVMEDLPFSDSEEVDVPKGTVGTVKEVAEGGDEGYWLHVYWKVGGRRGQSVYNVSPSQVELVT